MKNLYSTCEKLELNLKSIYVAELEYNFYWGGTKKYYSLTLGEMRATYPGYDVDEEQETYFKKRFQKLGIMIECGAWNGIKIDE